VAVDLDRAVGLVHVLEVALREVDLERLDGVLVVFDAIVPTMGAPTASR
jgi:hypothetical protein